MPVLPCLLCTDELEQRTTKNGKPYFVCFSCGTQFFVRGKKGRERLEELLRHLAEHNFAARSFSHTYFEIQRILNEIRALESQIKKLDLQAGIIFKNKKAVSASKSLKTRVKNLLIELEQIAQQKPTKIKTGGKN